MPAIDKTADDDFKLCWARGDDDEKVFTINNPDGTPANISTQTFSLAVNTDVNPGDTANEIFVVDGVLVTDGTDGKVGFTPPANSLDAVEAPGVATYDMNRKTPSKKTLVKGPVEFVQDVDKS